MCYSIEYSISGVYHNRTFYGLRGVLRIGWQGWRKDQYRWWGILSRSAKRADHISADKKTTRFWRNLSWVIFYTIIYYTYVMYMFYRCSFFLDGEGGGGEDRNPSGQSVIQYITLLCTHDTRLLYNVYPVTWSICYTCTRTCVTCI